MTTPQHPQSQLHKFDWQKPNAEQTVRIENMSDAVKVLAALVEANLPVSQERSVVMTKLREVRMWINAGIVLNGDPPTAT